MTDNEEFNIYTIIKSITYEKDETLINHPKFKKTYSQYSINSFMMAHPSTCHLAMYASENKMSDKQHYLFLLYCTDKKYIFFKREYKKRENKKSDFISKYYNINKKHAIDIMKNLSEAQIKSITDLYETPKLIKKAIERI